MVHVGSNEVEAALLLGNPMLPIAAQKEEPVTVSSSRTAGVETFLAESLWKVWAQMLEPFLRSVEFLFRK